VNVKCSHYRPGVAQRLGTGIALLFHDRGTRRGWVVSSTPWPHFTPGRDPVPIVQEAGWAPGPVWTDGKICPHRDSIPDRPSRSQSLYRLSYRAHKLQVDSSLLQHKIHNRNYSNIITYFPSGRGLILGHILYMEVVRVLFALLLYVYWFLIGLLSCSHQWWWVFF